MANSQQAVTMANALIGSSPGDSISERFRLAILRASDPDSRRCGCVSLGGCR